MLANKNRFDTVDDYIKSFPKDTQAVLQKVRQTIKKVAPKATEAISYQIPAFKLNSKYLLYYSGWKTHISLYPIPPGTEVFKKEIAPYVKGKGTISFSLDKPIPYGLIEKVAAFHLKNLATNDKAKKPAASSKSKT